ncbi:histidine acid phosphatase [Pseudomassariella vexata]|uniref:3-phytase n=1 Tax=Pseudomassariella vexata TaxID=1141098 RepID=A0A1Y2EHV7_9PEZI|nr:histidine acid phosphatase [Pseudomassariella vexata]ORY71158.1 histidine acid phosphatase [Pseudomassariella vexata]
MASSLLLGASLAAVGVSAAGQILAPTQDINYPSSGSAIDPLKWLGANGPWYAGPNVNDISPEVPENCYVDQAAYVLRHGSRYPDAGAYDGWVEMQSRFYAGNYTASGSLSFLPEWKTVLTNPPLQIAMENPTGAKEAHDLGYTLRTRYPDLYQDGDEFMVWANNYTRVLQTAQMFVRGFLGFSAPANGSVVSVTSKGFAAGIGDSLAPSDMCPNFEDASGGDNKTIWDNIWIPPVQERLQALIDGNLTLTASDIAQIPYLCGFESHITGRLSPWCDVFTDEELKQYEYSNDLRYYYGIGPGTDLPQKMMTPYLNALIDLFEQGPGITGTDADGSTFELPKLLMSFLNDGQLTELVTASGVFDEQALLSPTEKDDDRLWVGSRYVSMRGTIAFERLNCIISGGDETSTIQYPNATASAGPSTAPTTLSTSALATASTIRVFPTPAPTSAILDRRQSSNATYIRIRLNDAVYPVPSCKNGPGSSCLLSDYVQYVQTKYEAQGDWITNCNVTIEGAPTKVKGASFYTDLSSPWLQRIAP